MYTKLFSFENQTLSQLKFTHGINHFISKFFQKVIPLFLILYLPISAFAQSCPPEANFSYSVTDCDVTFSQLYTGPGTVTHLWEFFNSNTSGTPFSSSTAANPIHSFNPSSGNTVLVRHTIKITINGQTQTIVCEQNVGLNCQNPCSSYYFYYQVSGCMLTITNSLTGIPNTIWDFGDGTPPITYSGLPTHTYTTSGTYLVSVSINGKSCTLPVTIDCGGNPCCTAEFTAAVTNECGKLVLSLNALCKNGTHKWEIPNSACYSLITLQQTAPNQAIQITNIDTDVTTFLTVKHTYTCSDGTVLVQTQIVPILPKGIFIGVDSSTPTALSQYSCVLPNNSYTGQFTKPIFITGIINIDKSFAFISTDLQFHPGFTGFNIFVPNILLELKNGTFAEGIQGDVNNCDLLWRGLKLYDRGKISLDNATIRDALFGIDNNGPLSTINLNKANFVENYVGIYFRKSTGNFKMASTTFDGGADLKNAGVLLPLANSSIIAPSDNAFSFQNQPFSSTRGYAGIYLLKAPLTLNTLPAQTRNSFKNLNYGILSNNSNIRITRNSVFSDINITGGTNWTQSAAIALFNWSGTGNTLSLTGTLDENGVADISNSLNGVFLVSKVGASAARVDIHNMNINDVALGIDLDARSGNGTIVGNSTEPSGFTGIHNNRIHSTLEQPVLNIGGGIAFTDFSPTISKVEIYNNEVILETHTTIAGEFFTQYGNPVAISISGDDPFSSTTPGIDEVDIHDNRVVLADDGRLGIILNSFPNGLVRNNRGGSSSAGNGIFSTSNNFLVGIGSVWGHKNRFVCNDVETISNPLIDNPLQFIWGTSNAELKRNHLKGPGRGMYFDETCMDAEVRCNTMVNNTIGLYYGINGDTGLQGNQTEASGNVWELPMTTWQAQHASGFLTGANSQYYVRDLTTGSIIERPQFPNIDPNFLWFRKVNPGAPIVCNAQNCPIPPNVNIPPVITHTDSIIASNTGTYAIGVNWQMKFDLLRKLEENPFLVQTNSLMSSFKNGMSGTMTAAFLQAQAGMRTIFQPSDALSATINSNDADIQTILSDIATLNTTIESTTDAVVINNLYNQHLQKDS